MSDSNEQKKGIEGKDIALVLLTLGGVGGYLWLDHKLRIERKTNADLTAVLLQLAAIQSPSAPLPKLLPSARTQTHALPSATTPSRNAISLARLPRIELAPRTYDDVFANHGRGLPVPYLRALALHESDMRARLSDGPAWGLMQVIEVVREDHNRRERVNFTRHDLLDAAVNVTIAASLLGVIAKSYAANHPSSPNMQTNWRNPQFVALMTFGWNAGWSERGGVGRVVSFLEQRSADVNINSVFDAAKAAGASPHLCNPMKLAFAKQVTRQYFAELADEERVIEIEEPAKRPASDRPAVVVEVPSSPPASDGVPGEIPVLVVEDTEDSPGPITSPSQLEPASPGVVLAPMEVGANPIAPPIAVPAMPPMAAPATPPTAVPAMPPIAVPAMPPMAAPATPPIAAPVTPPMAVPAMPAMAAPATPPIAVPAMPAYPSGGGGPIDPYEEPIEPYGYPEDPYAYLYSQGAPHA